jgi:hypothetical protein
MEEAMEEQRAVAIARQRMREALYRNRNELAVAEVVDAFEEYVTARLNEECR